MELQVWVGVAQWDVIPEEGIVHLWNGTKMTQFVTIVVNLLIKSGSITQFKFYLSHIYPNSIGKKCPKVPWSETRDKR